MTNRVVPGLLLLVCTVALQSGGCAAQHGAPSTVQSSDYLIPPQQLAQDVKRIVSSPPLALPAQDEGNGVLLTGWQGPFRGDWHIVRYWHERTRYRISILPDFADPAHRARIQITDETQQRPDESGPNVEARTWHPAPDIHRPERSQAVLRRIETQIPRIPATTPAQ